MGRERITFPAGIETSTSQTATTTCFSCLDKLIFKPFWDTANLEVLVLKNQIKMPFGRRTDAMRIHQTADQCGIYLCLAWHHHRIQSFPFSSAVMKRKPSTMGHLKKKKTTIRKMRRKREKIEWIDYMAEYNKPSFVCAWDVPSVTPIRALTRPLLSPSLLFLLFHSIWPGW